ncbi:hypothetical protein GIS00_12110 [Nakamurella sp. YIM 132087]|uniref:Helicase-associated domain-containing protein n=1 Tax=Nakamurella alba TaxID=2665158 RepID=A0A7K1FKR6_9ACTN|nr:helicase associated domain-containing protein [Nakamurella alba]MTD14686.1 hypothetical protein [Nakamurella alba]
MTGSRGFVADDQRWQVQLRLLVTFVAAEHRWPHQSPQTTPAERRLGQWLGNQRRTNPPIDRHRQQQLDEQLPGWRRGRTGPPLKGASAGPVPVDHSIGGVPNEQFWSARLAELRAFIDQHDRPPRRTPTTPLHERSLSYWLGNQRRYLADGTLARHRRAQLDRLWPDWCSQVLLPAKADPNGNPVGRPRQVLGREARWVQMLANVQSFIEGQDRPPRTNAPGRDERRLATWLVTQRKNFRIGVLRANRIAQLNESISDWLQPADRFWSVIPNFEVPPPPSWTTADHGASPASASGFQIDNDRWLERLAAVIAHLAATGRPPRANRLMSVPEDERSLGNWLSHQRIENRSGRLSEDRRRLLDHRLPGWKGTHARHPLPAGRSDTSRPMNSPSS